MYENFIAKIFSDIFISLYMVCHSLGVNWTPWAHVSEWFPAGGSLVPYGGRL